MATQRQRLAQAMQNAGNQFANVKPLPVDRTIAPNVAPAARSGKAPVQATTPNPGAVQNAERADSLERAQLHGLMQRASRITRLRNG